MYLVLRGISTKNNFFKALPKEIRFTSNQSSSSGSSSSAGSSDGENKDSPNKSDAKKKSEEALNKLNDLLQKMVQEEVTTSKPKLNLAKPTNQRKPLEEEGVKSIKVQSTEKQMVDAVKNVANAIGGDTKQTESELLLKLLNPIDSDKDASASNLSDIVKGMKIDRDLKPEDHSRANQVRQILQRVGKTDSSAYSKPKRYPRHPRINQLTENVYEKIDLFGSKPLGIFTSDSASKATEGVVNKTWNTLYERELRLAVTHPPSNYFQQMILWTEQGKVWKFPIDNEQGMEEEKSIYFTEHVFLEKHLESWCPQSGPIRHFMELVCVGLSKNSYLSVEAKKEHIYWFKNYFDEKKQLLQEVGAFDVQKKIDDDVKT